MDTFRHTLVNEFLEHSAETYPQKVALVCGNTRMTYGELDELTNKFAYALVELGVQRGDRVAVFMDNSAEAVVSIYSILKAGAAFVMINHSTRSEKLKHIINNCGAKVLISEGNKRDVIRSIGARCLDHVILTGNNNSAAELSFEDVVNSGRNEKIRSGVIDCDLASIIYTSGSTGLPKGVMLSHLNIVSAAHSITKYLQNSNEDVIMNMLPLSFDYGLYQILMGFLIGGRVILENPACFPYKLVATMQEEKVTGLPGMPMIFAMLFALKDIGKFDLSSLRYITNTAVPLPENHILHLRDLFPWVRIYSMYGLTECKRVSFLPPEELEKRPGSVGIPMPNIEAFIVNEQGEEVSPGEIGELVVRGSNVMLGYWGMPEETAKCLRSGRYPGDKVLYTGDYFMKDSEGYLYFIRRKDDIIKSRGEKVSPLEIERVMSNMNGVRDVAVVGVSDCTLGQAIKAFVVLEEGAMLSQDEILNYCSKNLESNRIPRYIEFRQHLPKTDTGKTDKKKLSFTRVFDFLIDNAIKQPSKIAVSYQKSGVTYGELNRMTLRLASFLLKQGVKKGERIAILAENSPAYIASYFGIQMAGGVSVELNTQYSPHELLKVVINCGAKILIMEKRFLRSITRLLEETNQLKSLVLINTDLPSINETVIKRLIEQYGMHVHHFDDIMNTACETYDMPDVGSDDIASIIYTSGTTGDPKGVMISHDNFVANAQSIIEYLNLNSEDKVMVILPFYYSYGKSLLNTHIMIGGTLVIENSFMYPNVILDVMTMEEVTGFAGVPSTFAILLNRSNIRNYKFPNLRYITQAGGPMAPVHAAELSRILSNTDIYIMYGQTEATARLTYLPPEDLIRKSGSIGKAIPGVTIEVIKENGERACPGEEGEIVATGRNIMLGYWNNKEETAKVLKNGKLFTGDIAKIDDEGYLYIVGRRSDMIKSGAHRISPKEIEEAILCINEVHEVVVIGIDDEILGQIIRAIIVLKEGCKLTARDVTGFCKQRLAQFKIPKEIVFVEELPKTNSGKIRRHLCKDLVPVTGQ